MTPVLYYDPSALLACYKQETSIGVKNAEPGNLGRAAAAPTEPGCNFGGTRLSRGDLVWKPILGLRGIGAGCIGFDCFRQQAGKGEGIMQSSAKTVQEYLKELPAERREAIN